jgi:hypothetical protein
MTSMSALKPATDAIRVVVAAYEEAATPDVRAFWDQAVQSVNKLNRIYASRVWFEHLVRTDRGATLRIGVARDAAGTVVGLSPLRIHQIPIVFDIAARSLATVRVTAATLLGSERMVADVPGIHAQMFRGIMAGLPEIQCIYLDAVPVESPTFASVQDVTRGGFLPYVAATRPWHWIELGPRFDQYIGRMSSKSRGNIKRNARDLRDRGGSLELIRVETEQAIAPFLENAARVSMKSWQHRTIGQRIDVSDAAVRKYQDLARLGMVRSYLLECGKTPVAFVLGYQFDGVYQYLETGYDEDLADLSPGTVLLYQMLEDLFASNPPVALNFGVGDGGYKRRFGNHEARDASVFLFRQTVRNRLLRASHTAFRSAGRVAKRVLRRRVTA